MYYKVKLQSSPTGKVIVEEVSNKEAKGYETSVYSYQTISGSGGMFAVRKTVDEAKQALKKHWSKRIQELEKEIKRYQSIIEQL